jgi:hypothetical protein
MTNENITIPNRTAKDSVVAWTMSSLMLVILLILGLCFYWLVIDRAPPVDVHGGEVLRYERQRDDSWIIIVRWNGNRHRNCFGNSKRWISANGFWLPLMDIPYPPPSEGDVDIGEFSWEVPVLVPSYYVSTGHDHGNYSIRILYSCNPLQEYLFPIIVEPKPISFRIPIETQNDPTSPADPGPPTRTRRRSE